MLPLQIKRRVATDVDPKQLLRAHVEQLPIEKQREFVVEALRLLAQRDRSGRVVTVEEPRLLS